MRDGQAGLCHPPWRGWGVAGLRHVWSRGGFKRDLNALRLDASANFSKGDYLVEY